MGLTDFKIKLDGHAVLALDTAPCIYFIEANPVFETLVNEVFQRIGNGKLQAYTSLLTLTETLIYPLENHHDKLANNYRELLLKSQGITSLEVTASIAEKAAELRAKYSNKILRTPDAIQLATAIVMGCDAILTNDLAWKVVTEIEVIVLKDFAKIQSPK